MDQGQDQKPAPARPAPDGAKWMAVEVFGQRSHVGIVREVERFGGVFMEIAVLGRDGSFATLTYGGKAIFSFHEVTEERARELALPAWGYACSAFKAPSARPGRCATCGELEAAHRAAPQLAAGDDSMALARALEVREALRDQGAHEEMEIAQDLCDGRPTAKEVRDFLISLEPEILWRLPPKILADAGVSPPCARQGCGHEEHEHNDAVGCTGNDGECTCPGHIARPDQSAIEETPT